MVVKLNGLSTGEYLYVVVLSSLSPSLSINPIYPQEQPQTKYIPLCTRYRLLFFVSNKSIDRDVVYWSAIQQCIVRVGKLTGGWMHLVVELWTGRDGGIAFDFCRIELYTHGRSSVRRLLRPLCLYLFALVCDKRKERVGEALMLIIIITIYIIPPTPAPLAFNWPCGSATEDVNTCCHPLYVTKRQTVRHQCTPTLEELLYIIPCRLGCWNNKTIATAAA